MSKPPTPSTPLDQTFTTVLTRRKEHNRLRALTLHDPTTSTDFSSNSYLSLSTHPSIKEQYLARLRHPHPHAFSLGSRGSRLLDGNSPLAEHLETYIASFHGASASLLFNSGFDANAGLFACAPQEDDVVVYDELIHASVHDGVRLSRGRGVAFRHNRVRRRLGEDDDDDGDDDDGGGGGAASAGALPSLEEVLLGLESRADDDDDDDGTENAMLAGGESRRRRDRPNIFIAVEAVYSMDGDVCPLQSLVDCVEACLPRGNGYIVVDEAHSTGWMGHRGRGLVSLLGLEARIWARVHTFGKAMGCAGAAVLCTPTTRAYLINYARPLIFTTAMPFPLLAAIQTAYDFLATGQASALQANLTARIAQTHGLLVALSERRHPPRHLLRVDATPPASPIIPLFSGRARNLAAHCQARGYVVRPIVAPTVPPGTDRVRVCLHAANTAAEVRGLCLAIEEWLLGQMGEREEGVARTTSERSRGGEDTTMDKETQVRVASKL